MTAINPTPAGEGKTTTTVGLGTGYLESWAKKQLLHFVSHLLDHVSVLKGERPEAVYAQVVPMEDLNLHFTGDFHAITSANNLLAAMLDNHIQQGNALCISIHRPSRMETLCGYE